ncbi:hypothetical protein C5E23_19585 [Pectobacterium parmentieri]|nr:hypothetical protein C5E23_19585 [Pectobacterium parmentieri]
MVTRRRQSQTTLHSYDFGSVTTRRRFSQVTRIIPILETLVAVIDSRFSWSKIRQCRKDFKKIIQRQIKATTILFKN